MILPVTRVNPGDHVRTGTGEVIKVLCSQSAESPSASQWFLCGYAEGRPTRQMYVDPNFEVEVVS